jgi:hypothetical protein
MILDAFRGAFRGLAQIFQLLGIAIRGIPK